MTSERPDIQDGKTQNLYESKKDRYFQLVRKDVLDAIPIAQRGGKLLEIGAGECGTLSYAKEHGYAGAVYGIELVERDIDNTVLTLIDGLVVCDIQETQNPFADTLFDVILCPDVLEHLIDPYSVVNKLKEWLKPDGVVVASLPNINYWRTLVQLIGKDSFAYDERGILDRAHLRFFARKDVQYLFTEYGYEIVELRSNPGGGRGRLLLSLTRNLFRRFLTYQYIVVARLVPIK